MARKNKELDALQQIFVTHPERDSVFVENSRVPEFVRMVQLLEERKSEGASTYTVGHD